MEEVDNPPSARPPVGAQDPGGTLTQGPSYFDPPIMSEDEGGGRITPPHNITPCPSIPFLTRSEHSQLVDGSNKCLLTQELVPKEAIQTCHLVARKTSLTMVSTIYSILHNNNSTTILP